jgi:hypothetical protein
MLLRRVDMRRMCVSWGCQSGSYHGLHSAGPLRVADVPDGAFSFRFDLVLSKFKYSMKTDRIHLRIGIRNRMATA